MTLFSYVLAAMLFWSPLHYNINNEDPAERLSRYEDIASDIVEVAMDPKERPIFYGKYARERTAVMLASIAMRESGFHRRVDTGEMRGDNERSVCIMQVMTNMPGKFNFTAEYLLAHRKDCIRAGLAIARASQCTGKNLDYRFRGYASGNCERRAKPDSEARVAKAGRDLVKWYKQWVYRYPVARFFKS